MSVVKYKKDGVWTVLKTLRVMGVSEAINTGDIPDDIMTESERVVNAVKGRAVSNALTFIAVSDTHELAAEDTSDETTQEVSRRGNKNAGQGARVVADRLAPDFFCHLGDFIYGGGDTTEAGAMSALARVREYLGAVSTTRETFYTPGNHDGLHYSGVYLDYDRLSDIIGTYRYVDYEAKKVRVICLNTADNSTDETAYEHISGTQLQWFCEALDLSAKSDAGEWGVVLLSHHPLDWAGVSVAVDVITAYETGGNYAVTQDGVEVSKDFSGANAAKLIAAFHGHVHGFKVDTIAGTSLRRIAIPNAYFYRNNEYGENDTTDSNGIEFGEETSYDKTDDGTGKNTAFCVVTIDLDEEIIYADCFGAGYDRIISYGVEDVVTYSIINNLAGASNSNSATIVTEGASYSAAITADGGYELSAITVTMGGTDITASAVSGSNITISGVTGDIVITVTTVQEETEPSYINQVLTSVDTDGSVYNGTGYQEGYRLNSSGTTSELEGAVNSGYIPYSGEVIRIYGTTNGTVGYSGNYILFADAGFSRLGQYSMNGMVDYGSTWTELNGKYMLTFDPAACVNDTVSGVAAQAKYIRASFAVCDGGEFIVTLDEEIT